MGEPWERLAIDISGKYLKSCNENEYVLRVVNHFNKWAEAYPPRGHKTPTVAKVLLEQLFSRFGWDAVPVAKRLGP